MVLTASQTTAFFEDADQPDGNTTWTLYNKLLTTFDVQEDEFQNQRLAVGVTVGAMIPTPSFVFGAKSQKQLLAACDIISYYETTGRALTPGMIQWDSVTIKNFSGQWKALKDRKNGDEPVQQRK